MTHWIPDRAAEKILTGTFWSSAGWKAKPLVEPGPFAEAKRAGYMFEPCSFRHDALVSDLIGVRDRLDVAEIATAFATSLVSRRLDLRSALSSFAIFRNYRIHKPLVGSQPVYRSHCFTCGASFSEQWTVHVDRNILNFERFKWGGVRHLDARYAGFDLARFEASKPEVADPKGVVLLRRILEAAQALPPQARANDLLKAIAPIVPGNANERRGIISALGYTGILQSRSQPGFFESFPTERPHTGEYKNDWPYPILWWRASDGVNAEALAHYFPSLV